MHQSHRGFTAVELILLIAIMGVLASLLISAYQTYTVRSQVSESIASLSGTRKLVADAYARTGTPPVDWAEAGVTLHPQDPGGTYLSDVAILNGRIDMTFGNQAHQEITATTLSLTPYLSANDTIVWRCGNATAPAAATELSGGGITARHQAATVDARYLPGECR